MNIKCIWLFFVLSIFSGVTFADDKIDDVFFSKKPIKLIVSTKKDSLVYFPNPVKLKDSFNEVLDILITKDVVIIKALAPFDGEKLIFSDLNTEQTYIFNVSANNSSNPRGVRLLVPEEKKETKENLSDGNPYVRLVQHASMSLYYPERYAPTTKGVSEVRLKKGDASYFTAFNALVKPVYSWKGFSLFVTAVEVKNLGTQRLDIDPRIHFRGDWLFLSSQHQWMSGISDSRNNNTTVYVVSKRPFWESLL